MNSEEPTDSVKGAVGMAPDQAVGQTKDDKTCGGEPSIATAVTPRPGEVRGTIRFDDKACILAEEIDDERPEGMLATEFGPHDLPAAKHLPKHLSSRRGRTSQSTGHEGPGAEQTRHALVSATSRTCPSMFRLPSPSRRGVGGEVNPPRGPYSLCLALLSSFVASGCTYPNP